MAKDKSTLLNMVFTLFLVTLVSSASLGLVYKATKKPIEMAKTARMNTSLEEVVSQFNNDPFEDMQRVGIGEDTLEIYVAKQNDEITGYAVNTYTNNGFSGMIKLMVGFLPDGTINDIVVVEHNETPGLGDMIEKEKSDFSVQFKNKNPENFELSVKKDGGDVDGITASTISSRAYCDAVDRAYEAFKKKEEK